MYIYEVSTGCYSDQAHKILTHSEKYSSEEFTEICKRASESIIRKDDYNQNEDEICAKLVSDFGFVIPEISGCHFWDYSFNEENNFMPF